MDGLRLGPARRLERNAQRQLARLVDADGGGLAGRIGRRDDQTGPPADLVPARELRVAVAPIELQEHQMELVPAHHAHHARRQRLDGSGIDVPAPADVADDEELGRMTSRGLPEQRAVGTKGDDLSVEGLVVAAGPGAFRHGRQARDGGDGGGASLCGDGLGEEAAGPGIRVCRFREQEPEQRSGGGKHLDREYEFESVRFLGGGEELLPVDEVEVDAVLSRRVDDAGRKRIERQVANRTVG